METQNTLPEKLEVKRGGSAQYFIYLPGIMLVGLINTLFKIPPPYLYYSYMAIGVVLVMGMNTISTIVFTKKIIRATKEGIWTSKLNLVPWNQVKIIRLETTSTFNTGNMTSSTIKELIIETTDGRESGFWVGFLNIDPNQLYTTLNNYWQAYK